MDVDSMSFGWLRILRASVIFHVLALAPVLANAQVTVLSRATLIDGHGGPAQKDAAIVIEGGRIREIGPRAKMPIPPGANVVNVAGKFVVPGIINAHGHVGAKTEPQLRQYALYGVTTTTSMQTDPDEVIQVREAQERGELRGARVSTIKYRFAPEPEIATPQQARAKVDETVAAGADYIKLWVDGDSALAGSSVRRYVPRS
jgi:dihydroorotase-like cyclic amidohydrolase